MNVANVVACRCAVLLLASLAENVARVVHFVRIGERGNADVGTINIGNAISKARVDRHANASPAIAVEAVRKRVRHAAVCQRFAWFTDQARVDECAKDLVSKATEPLATEIEIRGAHQHFKLRHRRRFHPQRAANKLLFFATIVIASANVLDVAAGILCQTGNSKCDALADRHIDDAFDAVSGVFSGGKIETAFEPVRRLGRNKHEIAAKAVAAIQRALRPFLYLYPSKVHNRRNLAGTRLVDVVHIDAESRITRR